MAVRFEHHTLANAMDIIAEVNPDAHSASAGFFVRTGARDEADEIEGVSHYLEHMMFKGTLDLSADEINHGFDRIGARNNAYTTSELTAFHAHVLPERLTEVVDLLGRMMRPALRDEDFKVEKGVILEEIAMYKDNPFFVIYEETVARYYAPHPLAHRVLGTEESITALQRDQMLAYFENRYAADNTTLALAGKVDFDAVCAQAEALCAGWTATGATRDRTAPGAHPQTFTVHDDRLASAYILGVARAPAYDDDRRYAASMLADIYGSPDNSRLHWALIETGIAEDAQAAYDRRDGTGEYFVFAAGEPDRVDQIWGVVEREADALVDSLTDDDLERLRAKTATGATLSAERPNDMMHRIGRRWTYLRSYSSLEDELARINRVTLDDLRDVASAFPLKPITIGRLTP
jgi:predicted Zn-dependent peptidase